MKSYTQDYKIETEHPAYLDNGNMAELTAFLISEITRDDIFIDIGAHIGCVFIPVVDKANPIGAHAFEPTPNSFKYLEKNCKINLQDRGYMLHNLAVGDATQKVKFFEADIGSPSNTTEDRFEGKIEPYEIDQVRLDDFNFLDKNLVLKIDCELAEPKVWAGMKSHLPKVKAIVMEWFGDAYRAIGIDEQGFLDQIREDGFEIFSLDLWAHRQAWVPLMDVEILKSGKLDVIIKPKK